MSSRLPLLLLIGPLCAQEDFPLPSSQQVPAAPVYASCILTDPRPRLGAATPLRITVRAPVKMNEGDTAVLAVTVERVDLRKSPTARSPEKLRAEAEVKVIANRFVVAPTEARLLRADAILPLNIAWQLTATAAGSHQLIVDFSRWPEMASLMIDDILRVDTDRPGGGAYPISVVGMKPFVAVSVEVLTPGGMARSIEVDAGSLAWIWRSIALGLLPVTAVVATGLLFAMLHRRRRLQVSASTEVGAIAQQLSEPPPRGRLPLGVESGVQKGINLANTNRNPLTSTVPIELGRMKPWHSLRESDFLVPAQSLGDEEMKSVLKNVEEYGICQIRMTAMAPTADRLLHLEAAIGPACEVQNDFKGKVKSIEPKRGLAANSGDSAERLGFHVDGTQHESTPAILVFQYEARTQFGGDSTFLDVASIFAAMPRDQLEAVVTALARSDAATFRKKGMEFIGPLLRVERGSTLSCRLRFDADGDKVCHVNPACQQEFNALRVAVERAGGLQLKPREGDIIVFDNWRLMHGREEFRSRHQRLHDRMWIRDLKPQLIADYSIGVRGLGLGLMAHAQHANILPRVWIAKT